MICAKTRLTAFGNSTDKVNAEGTPNDGHDVTFTGRFTALVLVSDGQIILPAQRGSLTRGAEPDRLEQRGGEKLIQR